MYLMGVDMDDYIGKRFGRLTVIGEAEARNRNRRFVCRCDCGAVTTPFMHNLKSGCTTSCGCHAREESSRRAKRRGFGGYKGARRVSLGQFLANTRPNGECLEWLGTISATGYPRYGRRQTFVHRQVFLLVHGFLPEMVMHTCDNRKCINPEHLRAGNAKENMADMVAKGRQAKGERASQAKLTSEQVAEIRKLLSQGAKQREIAATFGVSKQLISAIKNNIVWKE